MKKGIKDKNPVLEIATRNLVTHLSAMDYDTKISWPELGAIAVKNNGALTGNQVMYCAKKAKVILLMDYKKCLANIHGFGLRIVLPEEHDSVAQAYGKRAMRAYRKGAEVLLATNLEKLNPEQVALVEKQAVKYKTLMLFSNEMIGKSEVPKQVAFKTANVQLRELEEAAAEVVTVKQKKNPFL